MFGLSVKAGLGLLATAGVATGVVVAASDPSGPSQAIVVNVVDGDTVDVQVDGSPERIRLLNIDTPETKDPNQPVQCLGPEASAFLTEMLPAGSPVRLEYDKERRDRYGRTLAAAFTPDGRMVNAEVVRAGLAQVVTFDDNVRFRPPIEQAWQEAADNNRGLHSPEIQCTFPGQVKTVSDSVATAPTAAAQPSDMNSQDLYKVADRTGLVRQSAVALGYALDRAQDDLLWKALTIGKQALLRDQARAAQDNVAREEAALRTAALTAKAREDEAVRVAAQAEADRFARQQAAAAADEQQRAAAQAQREEAQAQRAAQAQERAQARADAAAESRSSGGGGGGRRTGNSGHPCGPGERDGDGDGYCGEGR